MYSLFNNTVSSSVYTASSGILNRGKHVDRCEQGLFVGTFLSCTDGLFVGTILSCTDGL